MSIRVKSFLKDVGGAGRVTEARREKLKNASAVPDPKDPIRDLADKLHPSEMQLRVTDIRDASLTAKTFRFEAADGHIPVFQCGQFVNFRLKIGESLLTRPYTISSAPYEARGEHPFFEITVRRNVPYLVPDYFFENVHVAMCSRARCRSARSIGSRCATRPSSSRWPAAAASRRFTPWPRRSPTARCTAAG